MPEALLDRNSMAYGNFVDTAKQMAKSSGIISNTFNSLEPRAIKAISDGLCIPNAPTPPVFCLGPLVATNNQTGGGDEAECLTWLNSQPSRSVVFLSFGSMGLFKAEQLKDMAIGLENSGHRFLWVVRSPPRADDEAKRVLAPPEPDLDALLPQGFLDRTKDRGLVVKSWAPQVAVLSHDSVGGFVTHCGWNSALEAVSAGVPMLAWPLYAEQRMNRVYLVEEMKVALALNELEDRFVSAAELEKRVRELMDSESGKAVRETVIAMRDAAKAALGEGGSSTVALAELVESWDKDDTIGLGSFSMRPTLSSLFDGIKG
uniref:Putative anthocyanidin 5,3-O-glucosyltransferase-like n=1 Tax=Davidia involucrata TaxID=16924 RepID=A0A5B6YMI3_DAVIN